MWVCLSPQLDSAQRESFQTALNTELSAFGTIPNICHFGKDTVIALVNTRCSQKFHDHLLSVSYTIIINLKIMQTLME